MFGSSLTPVASRKAHILLWCLFFCLRIVMYNTGFYHTSLCSLFRVVMSATFSAWNDVRFVFTPVGCRRVHFWFMLVVFVYVWWCASRIDNMSNMVGVLWEREYAYLSQHLTSSFYLSVLCFFALFVFVLSTQYCQWLCIVHSWFPIRFSLTCLCWKFVFVFLLICFKQCFLWVPIWPSQTCVHQPLISDFSK